MDIAPSITQENMDSEIQINSGSKIQKKEGVSGAIIRGSVVNVGVPSEERSLGGDHNVELGCHS